MPSRPNTKTGRDSAQTPEQLQLPVENEYRQDDNEDLQATARRLSAVSIPSLHSSAKLSRTREDLSSSERVLITQTSDDDEEEEEEEESNYSRQGPNHLEKNIRPSSTRNSAISGRRSKAEVHSGRFSEEDGTVSDNDLESELGFYCVDIDNEEDFDTDLEIDDEEFLRGVYEHETSGVKGYVKECNRSGVIPVSYFKKHIEDREFIMRYHGLGPLGAKAISKPLEQNTHIQKLDLEGNDVDGDGAVYFSKMLADNLYITDLVLSDNNIGSVGSKALCEALSENGALRGLDLSGNGLRDCDGEHFCKLLKANSNLTKLILRHNKFEVEAARWFRDALVNNESLKILDLSWNHFRMKGGQYLADMIKENYGLKYLDLSMNGLGHLGAKLIGEALKHNCCLIEINLSCNRIPAAGAEEVAKGLQANDVIETLRIGQNPITNKGALALLRAIQSNLENTSIYMLDMSGVIVDEEFDQLEEKLKEQRGFQVIHGGVLFRPKHVIIPESEDLEAKFERDPMTKLKRFAEVNMLRLVDLFKQFDKDGSWSVSHDEFKQGIQTTGIDLSVDEMETLLARLDQDGDGEIDYAELAFGDKEHRAKKRQMKVWKKEMDEKGKDIKKPPEPVTILI